MKSADKPPKYTHACGFFCRSFSWNRDFKFHGFSVVSQGGGSLHKLLISGERDAASGFCCRWDREAKTLSVRVLTTKDISVCPKNLTFWLRSWLKPLDDRLPEQQSMKESKWPVWTKTKQTQKSHQVNFPTLAQRRSPQVWFIAALSASQEKAISLKV